MSVNLSVPYVRTILGPAILEEVLLSPKPTECQGHAQTPRNEKTLQNHETALEVLFLLTTVLGDALDGLGVMYQNWHHETSTQLTTPVARKLNEISERLLIYATATKTGKEVPEEKVPVLESNPIERKIALIKREKQENDTSLGTAKRQEFDDEEIRLLREKYFKAYTAELNQLLEKREAAQRGEPSENSEKVDAETKTPPASVDPDILAEKLEREDDIASLQADLIAAETDGTERSLVLALRKRLSNYIADLKHFNESLRQ